MRFLKNCARMPVSCVFVCVYASISYAPGMYGITWRSLRERSADVVQARILLYLDQTLP